MAKSYLYAVQDDTGREVCAVHLEPAKFGDVMASCDEARENVSIRHNGEVVASGSVPAAAEALLLHRWEADAKLSDPVTKRVC
jgi:hypothetical protein